MIFFPKKINTDKITETLVGFIDNGIDPLNNGVAESADGKLSEDQKKEIMAVPMVATVRAIMATMGNSQNSELILAKFQRVIFGRYSGDEKTRFENLFWERCDNYFKILDSGEEDIGVKLGEEFCQYFFGEEDVDSHLGTVILIGQSFLSHMVETKKFLDAIVSQYKVMEYRAHTKKQDSYQGRNKEKL